MWFEHKRTKDLETIKENEVPTTSTEVAVSSFSFRMVFSTFVNMSEIFCISREHHSAFPRSVHFPMMLGILRTVKHLREIVETSQHTESVTRCADLGGGSTVCEYGL